MTLVIPQALPPLPPGTAVKRQSDARLTTRLGFPGSFFTAQTPDQVLWAWDGIGNTVILAGHPAQVLQTTARSGEDAGALPDAPAAPDPVIAPVIEQPVLTAAELGPPSLVLPDNSEDPATWLAARLGPDVVKLRDWILSHGVTTPHATAWAQFAQSQGWSIPPPPEKDAVAAPDAAVVGEGAAQ